jgi:AcrR family transcriptional regulator
MSETKPVEPPHPRERILQASLELFVDQGYFNTNVPDISKKSKCSVGSIYHHFLNKEEIASSLYFAGIHQFRTALDSSIDAEKDLEKNIKALVTSFLSFSEDHILLSQYLWLARHNEFLTGKIGHPTTVGFDTLGRKLTKSIKDGMRKKIIPPIKADIMWSIIFGIPLSYIRDWLDGYSTRPPKEVAPILANACWEALHGAK